MSFSECSGFDFACYSGMSTLPMPHLHNDGDNFAFCDGHADHARGLYRTHDWFKAAAVVLIAAGFLLAVLGAAGVEDAAALGKWLSTMLKEAKG